MESESPILAVVDVVKTFGGLRAVDAATFDVRRGSVTALIGPNGAGKTTLFNVLSGFLRADGGSVVFDQREILGKPAHAVASMRMVRTFQLSKALEAMTVLDNMMLAAPRQTGERLSGIALRPRALRRRECEVRALAWQLLETISLTDRAGDYAGTLSGGQRKLLELGRALMTEPTLILLDEPMAGINRTLGGRLMDFIHDLRRREGKTVLYIEHDMDVVMNRSDHVIVMAQGHVIAQGTPTAVRKDPKVIEAYLGSDRMATTSAPAEEHGR